MDRFKVGHAVRPSRSAMTALLVGLASVSASSAIAQSGPVRPATRAAAPATPTQPSPVVVTLRAALVLPDMTVRPVPLHALELTPMDSTGAPGSPVAPSTSRMGLDGSAQPRLLPGRYRVRSVQAAALNDSLYSWDLVLDVRGPATTLELTNVNATAVAAAPTPKPAVSARQVAPEREAFEKVKRGVFRVEAGLGHGTGFLISVPGISEPLVVTNDHVVYGQSTASVYIDSVTRVPAQVVTRSHEADLALLRLPAGRCAECPRLALAAPKDGEPLVIAGERVLAIGFPLSQEMTLTTGVASSIRDGAIISDVNINPGNSGGPMLTTDGTVVAVNTFGESAGRVGPGVSGAVAITRLTPLLAEASGKLSTLPALADRSLPVVPRTVYPLAALKAHADTVQPKSYRKLLERSAGNFTLNTSTPVLYRVAQRIAEQEVSGDRRKRERKSNVAAQEQYSEVNEARDWEQYVGDAQTPVVTIAITPKVGETFWSAMGRGMQAASGSYVISPAQMKFRGDVRGARFYRNGVEVEPIRGGHGPQAVRVDNEWVKLKDVADMGYYVLPVEAFAPDSATGAPARVSIVVQDLKNPNSLSTTDIDNEASARVWNDFGPYFHSIPSGRAWRPADAKLKSPRIPLVCDPKTASCALIR
jgi:S1-C subfamily serine protease